MIMKLSQNPVRTARRKTELRDRLGVERPSCLYCGYTDLIALRQVSRKFLPEHHVLGRKHDPDLVIFACLNCHAEMHELLSDAGVELREVPDPIRRVVMMLRAEAVHFEMLADSKRRQAGILEGEK